MNSKLEKFDGYGIKVEVDLSIGIKVDNNINLERIVSPCYSFTDLEKLNLVKLRNGGLVLG